MTNLIAATAIKLGSTTVAAVYVGATKIWPVNSAPVPADLPANAPVITGAGQIAPLNMASYTDDYYYRPAYPGWLKFTATSTTPITIDTWLTTGTNTDTFLAVWDGIPDQAAGGTNVAPLFYDDDTNFDASGTVIGPARTSKVTFTPVTGHTYWIGVGGYVSSTPRMTALVLRWSAVS